MAAMAVLGLGAMGARMARRLLAAGHDVAVWNRTPAACDVVASHGARPAGSPRDAVAEVEVVIAMLRDDAASRAVWLDPDRGALAGIEPGAIAIESSTLSVGWARELAAQCQAAGVDFLDAPVAGSRPQAEAGQLIHLVGGDASTLARAEPLLRVMGGELHHAGRAGDGTAIKLAVNALLGVQVAALAELIGLLEKSGLDAARAVDILSATPVCSPAAKAAAASMLSGAFPPLFPVDLAEKDLGYALAAGAATGGALPITEAAWSVYAVALAKGFGAENHTGLVRLYRRPEDAIAP